MDEPEKRKGALATPTGRTAKLTLEVQQTIVESLSTCGIMTVAAMAAGISRYSLARWLERGQDETEGIYHDLFVAVTRARAAFIREAARVHRRWSIGGIIERPLTLKGSDEIELNADGEPIMVKAFVRPDLRAIEWELTRLHPEGYKSPDATQITQLNQQSLDVRLSLIDVLQSIGTIPDDDEPQAENANPDEPDDD